MKPATKAEVQVEMPKDWVANPVAILGRLESLIAGGLNMGFVEKKSGILEERIHALLDAKSRVKLGVTEDSGHFYQDRSKEAKDLFCLQLCLDEYANERRSKARQYTEIPTGLFISGLAMEALESKRLFHLIGGYGVSKTKTLERFAQKHPMTHAAPGAAYLALTDEDRTASQIYQRISDAIRINEKFVTRGRSIGQRVRNTFRDGDLLIVDEANYALERGTWPTLRDVFDGSLVSLMMVSNTSSNGFVKKNQDELGAFLSRARTRFIGKNMPADGEEYAKALGYTCSKIILEAGKMVSRTGPSGGMRFLAKAFEDAEKIAASRGKPVDVSILREAANLNSTFFQESKRGRND